MNIFRSFIMFIARLCLASIFFFGAASKIIAFDQTSQYMAAKGFPLTPLFLFGAVIVELIGGLSLVLGYKTRLGALLLLIFLIPTTYIFHDFWNLAEAQRTIESTNFLKNLSIIGGLLYVLCHGAGGFSFDRCCGCASNKLPIQKASEGNSFEQKTS